jgi:hypothetical protein
MPSPDFSELKFASVDLSLDKERCWEGSAQYSLPAYGTAHCSPVDREGSKRI